MITNSPLSLNLVWTIVGDSSVDICIEKCESFKTTLELVRGMSCFLVANMYWMIAFKIHVFDARLFEEMPEKTEI